MKILIKYRLYRMYRGFGWSVSNAIKEAYRRTA